MTKAAIYILLVISLLVMTGTVVVPQFLSDSLMSSKVDFFVYPVGAIGMIVCALSNLVYIHHADLAKEVRGLKFVAICCLISAFVILSVNFLHFGISISLVPGYIYSIFEIMDLVILLFIIPLGFFRLYHHSLINFQIEKLVILFSWISGLYWFYKRLFDDTYGVYSGPGDPLTQLRESFIAFWMSW